MKHVLTCGSWMDSMGLSIDSRAHVRFVDDPELAYVMQRYRQVHDFWHVLSGLEISVSAGTTEEKFCLPEPVT